MYEKNPIMLFPERDPKVFWYAPGRHWVMMLYGDRQYHIFTSANLLEWKNEHHPISDSFECPDFFELPVDGKEDQKKWVLIQGNGHYSIGSFDGKEFKEETKRFACDVGPHFYATQSWANTETGDGRRIQTAWMRGADFVDMPFSQMISFPCELTLRTTPDGLRIFRWPIEEIKLLHAGDDTWSRRILNNGQTLPLEPSGQLFHLQADVSVPEGAKVIFNLRGIPVVLTNKSIESGHPPAPIQGRITKVEILVDRTSIETFVNDGEVSSTRYALPRGNGITVKAEGGAIVINSLTIHPLKSAWRDSVMSN